jgi:hypothetical protein
MVGRIEMMLHIGEYCTGKLDRWDVLAFPGKIRLMGDAPRIRIVICAILDSPDTFEFLGQVSGTNIAGLSETATYRYLRTLF